MIMKNTNIIPIEKKILTIRGVKVMLDSDLASLYGVETRVLNQAVKRNKTRFPERFMFRLTREEWKDLRSQFVTFKQDIRKYPPFVFTEHGVTMLSSVLNSPRAIQINIQIIDAFIALRRYALAQKPENITYRINILEKFILQYANKNDKRIDEIVETINDMLSSEAEEKSPKKIGFVK